MRYTRLRVARYTFRGWAAPPVCAVPSWARPARYATCRRASSGSYTRLGAARAATSDRSTCRGVAFIHAVLGWATPGSGALGGDRTDCPFNGWYDVRFVIPRVV